MRSENYAFAVAKIRSLESKLVNPNQLERLVDNPDPSAFFEALSETAYAQHFDAQNDVYVFQNIINAELTQTKKTLEKIAPQPKELSWIWYKYDFANLKFIFKNHLAQTTIDIDKLNELGNIHPKDFDEYIQKQNKKNIPKTILLAIDKAKNSWQEKKNPHSIDLILDKTYFDILGETSKNISSRFVKKLIAEKIDLYNIGVLLRSKERKNEQINPLDFLTEGGNISPQTIKKYFNKEIAVIASDPKFYDYKKIIVLSNEYFQNFQSYVIFEKLSHEFFVNKLRYARLLAFGVEPLIAFWLAKDNEAKILRIVMISKLNNIPAKNIHEQIYKLYTQKI